VSEHADKPTDSPDDPAEAYQPPAVEDLDTQEGVSVTAAGVTITKIG
jgi:hypothetical protein